MSYSAPHDADDLGRLPQPVRRAVRITVLLNLAFLPLSAVIHGPDAWLFFGLMAGQTALLAARVGFGDELLSLRLWNAALGLVMHVAVIGIVIWSDDGRSLAISIAALGSGMLGAALVAWILSGLGLARRLQWTDNADHPLLRFSLSNLIAVTSTVAVLALFCRWATSVGEISPLHLALFAVHQAAIAAVATVCYGTMESRRLAGLVLMGLSIAAGLWLERTFSAATLIGRPFLAFELAQACILVVWFSAWRRVLDVSAGSTDRGRVVHH